MINVLLVGNLHHKNLNALQKYKNIKIFRDGGDIEKCNVIMSIDDFIPITDEDKVYIFGPHFSVFPDHKFTQYLENWKKNAIYNLLSDWCVNLWTNQIGDKHIANKLMCLPFGVDTEMFNEITPISQRNNVFIYYKTRDPIELEILQTFLNQRHINYVIFNYNTKYSEEDYLRYLQNSKYGIILGRHESQGFAIEEALSCNVPLLVWDVTNMGQEYGYNYPNYPATSIPYWDKRCGEYFFEKNELQETFNSFISNIDTYKPRQYILENLSMEKCEEKLINLINNIKSKM